MTDGLSDEDRLRNAYIDRQQAIRQQSGKLLAEVLTAVQNYLDLHDLNEEAQGEKHRRYEAAITGVRDALFEAVDPYEDPKKARRRIYRLTGR